MKALAARELPSSDTVNLLLRQYLRTVLDQWHRDGPVIADTAPAAEYFAARLLHELTRDGYTLCEGTPGDVVYFDACLNCHGTGVELTRSTNRAYDCPQCDGTGRAQDEGK